MLWRARIETHLPPGVVGLPYPEGLYAKLGSQGHVKLVNLGRVRDDTPLT